jgi:hypothetical protein
LKPSASRKLTSGKLRILPIDEFTVKLQKGEYQEHLFDGFAVYTQITDYGYEKVVDVVLLVGEGFPEKKEEVCERLADFARTHGCVAIEALSRKGLGPTLKDVGFRTTKVLLRKDLA